MREPASALRHRGVTAVSLDRTVIHRPLVAALAGLALAGCPSSQPPKQPDHSTDTIKPGNEPRLVVLLVIDQWPEWAFEKKRAALPGGFARLLGEGEWHVGLHPSAATLTAAGHALLSTGEPPWHSGILA